MAKRQMIFSFPRELIREPIIYNLSQQFGIATNICRANVSEDEGWVVLEMEGKLEDIEQGIVWVISRGVRVEPVTDDIAER